MKVYKWIAAVLAAGCMTACQDEVYLEDTSQALSPASSLTVYLKVTAQQQDQGCLAVNYPLTVYAYNSSFQVEDMFVIDDNEEFNSFLQGIEQNEYYALDYPMSVTVAGQTQMAESNVALTSILDNAFDTCNIHVAGECDNPGVLTDDLIVYMTFANNTQDLMGGTVTAPDATFVADRSGNSQCAISFNGSQQVQIESTEFNSLVPGNVFSISLWFRMQNGDPSNYEHFFRKGLQGEQGFNLSVYDNNTPLFGVPSAQLWDNNWNQDLNLPQDVSNWHHLVITFDANSTARLYRDGVLQNIETFNADIGATALNYYIGQNFTGFLDDLRVYRKVLTQAEVQTLFGLEGDCSTCVE